jgi:hypothetical protein
MSSHLVSRLLGKFVSNRRLGFECLSPVKNNYHSPRSAEVPLPKGGWSRSAIPVEKLYSNASLFLSCPSKHASRR